MQSLRLTCFIRRLHHGGCCTYGHLMPRAVGAFRKAGFDVLAFPIHLRTGDWNEMWKADSTGSENLRKLDMAAYEWFGLLQTERLLGRVVSSANRKLKQQYARSSFRKATAAFAASHSIHRLGGCRRVFFWIGAQGTIKTDEMTSGSFKSRGPRCRNHDCNELAEAFGSWISGRCRSKKAWAQLVSVVERTR
jgi:hypothetical protein